MYFIINICKASVYDYFCCCNSAGAAAAAHAVPNQTKGQNKGGHKQLQENEVDNSRGEGEATSERNVNMAQSVVEVHEFAQNVVQVIISLEELCTTCYYDFSKLSFFLLLVGSLGWVGWLVKAASCRSRASHLAMFGWVVKWG